MPVNLRVAAFSAGEELAWPRDIAFEVIDWLSERGLPICGVEIWLPSKSGPEIPSPFFYTWEAKVQAEEELWLDLVKRSNQGARRYIKDFQWDQKDLAYQHREPFFNLEVLTTRP